MVWCTAQIPVIGMPFVLLSTWAHELGHGLGAMITGGHFAHMRLSPDFGGVAHTSTSSDFGRVIVLLGGLLGPYLAGAFLLILSRGFNRSRFALVLLCIGIFLTVVFWSANMFTRLTLLGIGVAIAAIAYRSPAKVQSIFAHIVAIAFCMNAVTRFDYFFAAKAVVGTSNGQSDTSALTDIIGGPHLLWGLLLSATSLFILYFAFRISTKLAHNASRTK